MAFMIRRFTVRKDTQVSIKIFETGNGVIEQYHSIL